MNALYEAAQVACCKIGVIFRPIPTDGKFHPLDADGKSTNNGAGRIRMFPDGEGGQVWNHAAENPTEHTLLFWAKCGKTLSPSEAAERRIRIKEEQEKAEILLAEKRADAAKLANRVWKGSKPPEGNLYLLRKQVEPTDTLREMPLDVLIGFIGYHPQLKGIKITGDRILIVPVSNGKGITTIEMIDEDGRKPALSDGQKKGCFWSTNKLPSNNGTGLTIGIGEGVATMLTYNVATGYIGISALSCGNLKTVAEYFRGRYPEATLVIVSDIGFGEQAAVEAALSVNAMIAKPILPDGSTGTDINDLYTECGIEAVLSCLKLAVTVSALEQFVATVATVAVADGLWPEPSPIDSKIEPAQYPLDALPESIRLAVEEVLKFVKAPVPLVASAALSALSMAVQSHADVERAVKLSGPSSTFMLTIAESGERKSTCDGYFSAAIRDYETNQSEVAKPLIRQYEAKFAAWDMKYSGVKDSIRAASKSGKPTNELETELLQLQLDKPEPPRVPRIIYGDATPAALKYNLAKGWPSGAVVSSEAGIVFGGHGMKKDSAMENLATLNQLWDGTDQHTERRATESYTVKGARFTMSLMVQEATLRAFFKQDGGLARGTGFLARFLIAWPESTQGHRRFTDSPEHWPYLEAFSRRISAILNQPVPIDDYGALHPPKLALTPDAKAAWVAFHDDIESMLVSGGELFDIRDVASKTADNAARLACQFHVFSGDDGAISLDAFESASKITAWHLNEARRFFGGLALPQELADAERLDSWMLEYCRREKTDNVPTRKIQQYGPSGLRTNQFIYSAMEVLEDHGRSRFVKDGKKKSIQINPALLAGDL